uniref:L3MBTL histone methyl-lysine binding protein 4 n=1 Tax=Cyprinus carpio TaxID=7962 RepID=A0A8C1QSR7_CYPCA
IFQAFPDSRNGFKVGMRLEGIDPLHPSMFCVLSVAEVIGFRLRLHIDGYSECYDFWVNADCPDIKPAGWCESTGHKLHPPKGALVLLHSAPLSSCKIINMSCDIENNRLNPSSGSVFEVGMKLEAVDRKNPCLVCVASVADIVDQRFLVHFDNWDDTYDYWCDASSPYIHPVGWCQDHGRPLTAPQGHPNPEHFVWEEYMEDTGASAAPSQAFSERSPHGFQTHMKLEAVDRRNPMLIRVATVADTEDHRVKVHFDGWHEKFDFWVDSDLPDLHPVGWCSRTGHPLEPPPLDMKSSVTQGVCPTPGCRGIGHIKGAKYTGHHSAFGCPYSDMNMKKEVVLPDRLGGENCLDSHSDGTHSLQKTHSSTTFCFSIECIKTTKNIIKRNVEGLQQALHQSVFLSAMSAHPSRDLPLCWEQHCKLLPGVAGVQASRVSHWTAEEVRSAPSRSGLSAAHI